MSDYVYNVSDNLIFSDACDGNKDSKQASDSLLIEISSIEIDNNVLSSNVEISSDTLAENNEIYINDSIYPSGIDDKSIINMINVEDFIFPSGNLNSDINCYIISPSGGSVFYYGEDIEFIANLSELDINNEDVYWSSSINGLFGFGNNITYKKLSVGNHDIKLLINETEFFDIINIDIENSGSSIVGTIINMEEL